MTGSKTGVADTFLDDSRYQSHAGIVIPGEQEPVLMREHTYIIIWGYWNGTDEMLADYDGNYYAAVNALNAYRRHLIDEATYFGVVEDVRDRMLSVGIKDLNLRGTHILLSLDPEGELVVDENGLPTTRICNFEFLQRSGRIS
jgi:hypothetical protein